MLNLKRFSVKVRKKFSPPHRAILTHDHQQQQHDRLTGSTFRPTSPLRYHLFRPLQHPTTHNIPRPYSRPPSMIHILPQRDSPRSMIQSIQSVILHCSVMSVLQVSHRMMKVQLQPSNSNYLNPRRRNSFNHHPKSFNHHPNNLNLWRINRQRSNNLHQPNLYPR